MINYRLILLYCFVNSQIYGQNNIFKITFENNLLNYNKELVKLKDKYEYDFTIKNNSISFSYNLLAKKKLNYYIGFSCRKTYLQVFDRIKHWNYETSYFSSGVYYYDTIYQILKDPADLISYSYNFGINHELTFDIKNYGKFETKLGVKSEIYLFERFKSYYYTTDSNQGSTNNLSDNQTKPFTISYENKNRLFLSSANISLFYRMSYKIKDKFSLATKISLGTNLYSDWDQFKKYAWLGVGLELGFGNKPLFKKKSSNFD